MLAKGRAGLIVAALALGGCGSITVPVAVISDGGETMHGTSTASLSGGSFQVAGRFRGKNMNCSGTYNALDTAKTISMPVACSNGQTGTVTATRDSTGMNGQGTVRLSDGSRGRFVFGNAALARVLGEVNRPVAQTAPSAPSLPDAKWVAAQTEPYFKCGRDAAIRLAVTLPNESAADVATAADLRCATAFGRFERAVKPRLPADLYYDAAEVARQNFRRLAISTALAAREQIRTAPPARKPPPPPKPQLDEREA